MITIPPFLKKMNEDEIIKEAMQMLPKGCPAEFYEKLEQVVRDRSSTKMFQLLSEQQIFQHSFAFLHFLRDKGIFTNDLKKFEKYRLVEVKKTTFEILDSFAESLRERQQQQANTIHRGQKPTLQTNK